MGNKKTSNRQQQGLYYSKPINFFLCSNFPHVDALVNDILGELIAHIQSNHQIKRVHRDKIKESLSIVILNLYSVFTTNPKKYLSYPRGNNNFSRDNSRYKNQDIGYETFIKRVVNGLKELDYIEDHTGFYEKDFNYGMNSRMRASSKLSELFTEHKLAPIMIERDTSEEVIILKDCSIDEHYQKNKFIVEYEDTETTHQMRESLQMINHLLTTQFIDLHITDKEQDELDKELRRKDKESLDFTRVRLKRIFNNNSFEEGGRFYHGWWQGIPKKYREFITISDKKTDEVDYSSIHPRILYAREGVDIADKDPYTIQGYEDRRNVIKVAFNIILNAETKEKAINAISKGDKLNISKKTALEIYQQLEVQHPLIKKYFGSGEGVRLQYIDSQIAERVMVNLARDNIVALPVHDSFIVRKSHRLDLQIEMNNVFKELIGIPPKQDTKLPKHKIKREIAEADKLYGDRGLRYYDDEGNLEGVIVSGADINPHELFKLDDEYSYHQKRLGEWYEHKGHIW